MNREDEIQAEVEVFGVINCPRCDSICRIMPLSYDMERVYVLCDCCSIFGPAKKTVVDAVAGYGQYVVLVDEAISAKMYITTRRALLINARRDHHGHSEIVSRENDVRDAIISEVLARRRAHEFIADESSS